MWVRVGCVNMEEKRPCNTTHLLLAAPKDCSMGRAGKGGNANRQASQREGVGCSSHTSRYTGRKRQLLSLSLSTNNHTFPVPSHRSAPWTNTTQTENSNLNSGTVPPHFIYTHSTKLLLFVHTCTHTHSRVAVRMRQDSTLGRRRRRRRKTRMERVRTNNDDSQGSVECSVKVGKGYEY